MQNSTLAYFQETLIKLDVDVKLTTFHWVLNTEPLLNTCAILLDNHRSRVVCYALGLICNYFLPQDPFQNHWIQIQWQRDISTHNWEKACISSYWTRSTTPCQKKAMPSVAGNKLLITNPTTSPAGFHFLLPQTAPGLIHDSMLSTFMGCSMLTHATALIYKCIHCWLANLAEKPSKYLDNKYQTESRETWRPE